MRSLLLAVTHANGYLRNCNNSVILFCKGTALGGDVRYEKNTVCIH